MTIETETTICASCGAKDEGGIFTTGDAHSDGPHVGIPVGERLFYCHICSIAGKVPDREAEITAEFANRGLCGFMGRWSGRCRNRQPCIGHALLKCWICSSKAVSETEEYRPACSAHS